MNIFCYGLKEEDYTWTNALLWGNCIEHFKKVSQGCLGDRIVHFFIALAELPPIISQIVSIFEKIIITNAITNERIAITNERMNRLSLHLQREEEIRRLEAMKNFLVELTEVVFPQSKIPVDIADADKIETDSPALEAEYQKVLDETVEFNGYEIELPEDHPCKGIVLTEVSVRPANLFLKALFRDSSIATTRPGSSKLFAFNQPAEVIGNYCREKFEICPDTVISFTAKKRKGFIPLPDWKTVPFKSTICHVIEDLSEIFGDKVYRISLEEIVQTLDSQKIYLSSMLPRKFYQDLKKAMKESQIITLPGNDEDPLTLNELINSKSPVGTFLNDVKANPTEFGFSSVEYFEKFLRLTIYQIGSMVVKSEDYRILIDGDGKIRERNPGQQDAIRLINACGIRGIHSRKTPPKVNRDIMTETYKAVFKAAESGIIVFPAVGMGVWRGDPDIYWRAFLDALVDSEAVMDKIFVNPGHKKTRSGKYKDHGGEEFQKILNGYCNHYKDNPKILEKLKRVVNLFDANEDIVQLAHNLKVAFPDKTVSLCNASDPDVTLGYHVGEYVNNLPHICTTEENYTAMGTNGLCFEGITGVHESEDRIIQA